MMTLKSNSVYSTPAPISQESVLRIKLQHLEELVRLASKDVLAKERKIEALKIENLRLKRLVKSQSEGVGA
jgi:hypothetical protein